MFTKLKRILHWGPITALFIIKSISFMTMHCISMWAPPHKSLCGAINSSCFLLVSGLTLYNFLSTMLEGPGELPKEWKPENFQDKEFLQYCNICMGYKAPRAHHCRKCNKCILKMDHHCPWINNCVGHKNHATFAAFLFWAVCGCSHAAVILMCSLYQAMNQSWYLYYEESRHFLVIFTTTSLVYCVFCLGLSIGVVLGVGILLIFQIKSIMINRTAIEEWILEKSSCREPAKPFTFPYNLGWKQNLLEVFWHEGNGIYWPVKEGCDQFTLTREQQHQKLEKRQRTRTMLIKTDYSGTIFPLRLGCLVCIKQPISDEPRLVLKKGEIVKVTRIKSHWLFGHKTALEQNRKLRGWFPRICAKDITDKISLTKNLHISSNTTKNK